MDYAGARSQFMEIDERANGTAVSLTAGGSLAICLIEKPTTGFKWCLIRAGHPALVPGGDEAVPGRGAYGAGGLRRWHFIAERPGTGWIELAYRRSWERDSPPAQVFTVEVRVQ